MHLGLHEADLAGERHAVRRDTVARQPGGGTVAGGDGAEERRAGVVGLRQHAGQVAAPAAAAAFGREGLPGGLLVIVRIQPIRVAPRQTAVFIRGDGLDERSHVGHHGQLLLVEELARLDQGRVQAQRQPPVVEGSQVVGADGQQATRRSRFGQADAAAAQRAVAIPGAAVGGHHGVGLIVAAVHEQADEGLVVVAGRTLCGGGSHVCQVQRKAAGCSQRQAQARFQQLATALVGTAMVMIVRVVVAHFSTR